jgi:hypothetical protein
VCVRERERERERDRERERERESIIYIFYILHLYTFIIRIIYIHIYITDNQYIHIYITDNLIHPYTHTLRQVDDNGDKTIDLIEFTRHVKPSLRAQHAGGGFDSFVSQKFSEIDRDRTGFVSLLYIYIHTHTHTYTHTHTHTCPASSRKSTKTGLAL